MLIHYKEVIRKHGQDLSELFYTTDIFRVEQISAKSFLVTGQHSGEGVYFINKITDSLDEAMEEIK